MSYLKEINWSFNYLMDVRNKPRGDIVVDGDKGPYIGVHGFAGTYPDEGLSGFMRQNHVKGILIDMGLMQKGILTYVPRVEDSIIENPGCTVIGYSAGGIAALEAARRRGFDKVQKIITVATPFDGLPRPARLLGGTIRDISRGSELLESIGNLNPPHGKVISVFAEGDTLAPKPKKSLNWETQVVAAQTHGDIQSNIKWIENILNSGLKSD